MAEPRLTIIGLDSATFDVIDPLIEAGDLPNLSRLLDGGARGTLRSTIHPLTPQAWSTMATGVNAGRHGIWDFPERFGSGYELRIVNGSYRMAPAIWDHLTRAGRRVGLVNIPFTWPAPAVDGFVVSGFDTAAHDDMTYPRELLSEILRRHGALELDHKAPLTASGEIDLDRIRRSAEQKVAIALELGERFDPELLFLVFMSADHVQHLAWNDWERSRLASPVADVYRILDDSLGQLLGALPADHDVLVVSDHGAGTLRGVVNLNAWLAEQGLLTYREASAALPRRTLKGALGLRRKLLPESVRRGIKRAAPDLAARAVRSSIAHLIDMERTRAFAYGAFGNIVLNVRGREEQGIVEPGEEYERVREDITQGLLELRSPEGDRIVRAVHRREDLYDGPMLGKAPDLIVEFDDYAWLGKGNLKSRTPTIWDEVEIESGSAYSYVGSHRLEGIVVVAGPSAAPGVSLSAGIEDIAPTALYLLGEPVPVDMEGRVLVEAIDPSILDRRPVEYVETDDVETRSPESYDSAEAAEVESRLRSLGYLD